MGEGRGLAGTLRGGGAWGEALGSADDPWLTQQRGQSSEGERAQQLSGAHLGGGVLPTALPPLDKGRRCPCKRILRRRWTSTY